jgi:hypothetical protein
MTLYKNWCTGTEERNSRKSLCTYTEKKGGCAKVLSTLAETVKARDAHSG